MHKPGWMTQERARRIREKAEENVAEEMRRLHDTGEISHLYGQPLEFDDDPDWLVTRVLKNQGYSHPLLEAARDLDEPRHRAEDVLDRLRRRYRWLTDPSSGCTKEQAAAFNALREEALSEYRSRLETLNRGIRDYNLSVPEALHQRPALIDRTVARAAEEIPPITAPEKPTRKARWFRR
jgi:hypothetical protein